MTFQHAVTESRPTQGGVSDSRHNWLWTTLIAIGLVAALYRESGTFSQIKGAVGVRLEAALQTSVFSPPVTDVPLRAALWGGIVVCALVLRRLRWMQWPAAGVLSALAILAMWAESSLWRVWGHRASQALEECEIVIQTPDVDGLQLLHEFGPPSGGCSITGRGGQLVLAIYPEWEHRVGKVIELLRQRGYSVVRNAPSGSALWVRNRVQDATASGGARVDDADNAAPMRDGS